MPNEVLKDVGRFSSHADLSHDEMPFTGLNREAKMIIAHAGFSRQLAAPGRDGKRYRPWATLHRAVLRRSALLPLSPSFVWLSPQRQLCY